MDIYLFKYILLPIPKYLIWVDPNQSPSKEPSYVYTLMCWLQAMRLLALAGEKVSRPNIVHWLHEMSSTLKMEKITSFVEQCYVDEILANEGNLG